MNANRLCAIPARAGSKRLPGKNLRLLAGKPLLVHTIECARRSGRFADIYVCTEDETLARVAREHGAQVPFLMPPELCGDLVPSHVPCQKLAAWLEEQGRPPDTLVCLQPTSPLRAVEDIHNALARFEEGDLDFLVSVTPIDPHYFHWAVVPAESGAWKMYFGEQFLRERSLLPGAFRPNGSIKIARPNKLAASGHFFGSRLGVVETPEERSVHVATEFDLRLCECLLNSGLAA